MVASAPLLAVPWNPPLLLMLVEFLLKYERSAELVVSYAWKLMAEYGNLTSG
jgi:hypothetical protein